MVFLVGIDVSGFHLDSDSWWLFDGWWFGVSLVVIIICVMLVGIVSWEESNWSSVIELGHWCAIFPIVVVCAVIVYAISVNSRVSVIIVNPGCI
jgi:hypothetical protein